MVSKVLCSVLVVLLVAQVSFADRELCPNSDDAEQLVYKESYVEDAPPGGRIEKWFSIPAPENRFNCINLSSSTSRNPSITVIGLLDDGSAAVRTVSDIKEGLNIELEAFTS